MKLSSLFTTIAIVLLGVLIKLPIPSLDWEGTVLPLARSFAGSSSSSSSSPDDKTPLEGKIVVITGATAGIGLGLARAYSKLGATVVGMGRSEHKLADLKDELASAVTIQADFIDLDSVNQAADKILESFDHIDILINNAGMYPQGIKDGYATKKGHDMVFTINYLSHFLLTQKLSPIMKNATILQTSSSMHWFVTGDDLVPVGDKAPLASQPGGSPGFYVFQKSRMYANSKFAQIMFARALKKYNPNLENARIVAFCPAFVATEIMRARKGIANIQGRLHYSMNGFGLASSFLAAFDGSKDDDGDYYVNTPLTALPQIAVPSYFSDEIPLRDLVFSFYAVVVFFTEKVFPGAQKAQSSPETYDEKKIKALYDWSLKELSEYL